MSILCVHVKRRPRPIWQYSRCLHVAACRCFNLVAERTPRIWHEVWMRRSNCEGAIGLNAATPCLQWQPEALYKSLPSPAAPRPMNPSSRIFSIIWEFENVQKTDGRKQTKLIMATDNHQAFVGLDLFMNGIVGRTSSIMARVLSQSHSHATSFGLLHPNQPNSTQSSSNLCGVPL